MVKRIQQRNDGDRNGFILSLSL